MRRKRGSPDKTLDLSAHEWRRITLQIYDAGAQVSDEIDAANADAAYARPSGSLLATLHEPSAAEKRRAATDVIRQLADDHGSDQASLRLSLRFYLAVRQIRTNVDKRSAESLLSFRHRLSPRKVIQLGRLSQKRILRFLGDLERGHRGIVN